ncbi:hypothetical protein OROHE_012523 [Orobanche hederae]
MSHPSKDQACTLHHSYLVVFHSCSIRHSAVVNMDEEERIVYGLDTRDEERVRKMFEAAHMVKELSLLKGEQLNKQEELLDAISSYNTLADEIAEENVITISQNDEIEGSEEFLKAKPDWTGEVHVQKKNKERRKFLKAKVEALVKDRNIIVS